MNKEQITFMTERQMNNLINKPFRLTLEQYDIKITVEKSHSDIDAEQLKELLRSLCLAAGFSEQTINEMFEENVW